MSNHLVFYWLFGTVNYRFLVRVSYLQIYNEDVCDLLGKNPTTKLEVFYMVYNRVVRGCVHAYMCVSV